MSALSGFGTVLGLGTSLLELGLSENHALKQENLQKRVFEYQKWLNQRQMDREDSSYQRKLTDITAAGFNPILAASGSGEPSAALKSAPYVEAPNRAVGLHNAVQNFMALANMRKDFAVKDAEIQKLLADKRKADAEASGIEIDNQYKPDYLLNRNVSVRLENEGIAGRNIAQSLHNAILENDWYLSESTKFIDVEKAYVDLDSRKKALLLVDADIILKSDEHFYNVYKNAVKKVESDYASRFAEKKLGSATQDFVSKAIALSMIEADCKLYFQIKGDLERKGVSADVIRKKLQGQFGSAASVYDSMHNLITSAGFKAGEWLRDVGINMELVP